MGERAGSGGRGAELRRRAAADPVSFWEEQAGSLSWFRGWDRALDWNPPFARWFAGGRINASHNALDVHLGRLSGKPAIVWEGEGGEERTVTYGGLHGTVCRAANALKSLGVGRGDRVAVYMPMIPEAVAAMLACARIGAVHAVVFSGFSADSLRRRIEDSGASVVVTADEGRRRGSAVRLRDAVDGALAGLPGGRGPVRHVVEVRRAGAPPPPPRAGPGPRRWSWDELLEAAPAWCPAEELDSAHPLFILYTSGTTGRPKGVLHGTGGYLVHLHSTFRWAFDVRDDDVYFCTADVGWVTGHSYVAYGPLLHGATQVMYEGAPDHPGPGRLWDVAERRRATILYTTPTALRMSMRPGAGVPGGRDLSRLRLLGSVGEPIGPAVWEWYRDEVGGGRCPVIDTWWQTETGGIMASALPGLEDAPLKPGSAGPPIPGVRMRVVDGGGRAVPDGRRGQLVVDGPWPGMMLTLWGDDERYEKAYWSRYPGSYHAGDYAVRDGDGYLRLLGRADDVLNVAGHRLGTAELEGAVAEHPGVAEAAVCAVPDAVKGEVAAAFVVPSGAAAAGDLRAGVAETVRRRIGPVAVPAAIHVVPALPKTRSGKTMRRLLRALAAGGDAGDTSTMEDGGAEAVEAVKRALSGGA